MPAVFRQRPPEVEAVQYLPGTNCQELSDFLGRAVHPDGECLPDSALAFPSWPGPGDGMARPGDWIVRGPDGEHFPCPADVFAETYEPS